MFRMLNLFGGVLWICSLVQAGEPATWPQWRGPTRDGMVVGEAWPDVLKGDALTSSWKVELGPGYSGPIVAADRVFVCETENKTNEVVRALDRKTGQELWRASWPGSMSVIFIAKPNGDWIRSTPAYDGERLYVGGIREVMVCLDAKTGAEVWRVDFLKEFKGDLPPFGFVSSPLLDGEHLYIQAIGSFLKMEKRTGKVVWRVLVEDSSAAFENPFSSPTFATIQGVRQIVVQTRKEMTGVDPESGNVLWRREVPAFRGMNILTPTIYKDSAFTSTYGGRTFFFAVGRSSGVFEVKEAWNNKVQGYMSSPIVIDGFAYLHLRNQRCACIDLATGKERWITSQRFGKYWSMVANKDKILALDDGGILFLIHANPEKFEQLDSRKVAEDSWAHLAVAGDEVFVRDLGAITSYRWRKPSTPR